MSKAQKTQAHPGKSKLDVLPEPYETLCEFLLAL